MARCMAEWPEMKISVPLGSESELVIVIVQPPNIAETSAFIDPVRVTYRLPNPCNHLLTLTT